VSLPAAIIVANSLFATSADFTGAANDLTSVFLVGLAAVVLAAHQWWWLDDRVRLVTEIAALFWATIVAILVFVSGALPVAALCLLIFGVALVIAGWPRERRLYAWVAIGVLTLASWAQLAHLGSRTVELYTVPPALVLLAIGAYALWRNPAASSWRTLLPGLLLGLLPSATLAVAEPVSLRALLVGGCALALILIGLTRHLAACFVTGAIVLAVLAVVEVWPYAAYVPRWAGLAAAGALLLAIGVRWEARLRDLRRVGGYLRGLR
ncbi:MAG: hypothetical protein Q4F67_08325, partial [Propionibacteriaceae bacterium]|nr:hypothetical protein [Propionibacteriaceae bacterium]